MKETKTKCTLFDLAAAQLEYLGYVDIVTGKESDVRNLIVSDIFAMKDKETNTPWGYRLHVRSIGSGNTAVLTVPKRAFDEQPIVVGDIVRGEVIKRNAKGYWYLYEYKRIGKLPMQKPA